MEVKCYKGAKDSDITTIEVEESAILEDVRSLLIQKGFIEPDNRQKGIAYRFIIKRTKKEPGKEKMTLDDSVMPIDIEDIATVHKIWGFEKQIVLTNIDAPRPDLVGFACDSWNNRYASASCSLNLIDPEAIKQNNAIAAFKPMMLTDVLSTNKNKIANFENVCICKKGSVVQFGISSWGAVGFHYKIEPGVGNPIVKGLYHTFDDSPDRYEQTSTRSWQEKGKIIEIQAVDELSGLIPGNRMAYQKIIISTRNLISYKKGDKSYSSDATPPIPTLPGSRQILLAGNFASEYDIRRSLATAPMNENIMVDGDSITPGTATTGGGSTETYGTIHSCVTAPWEEALGVIVIHFFVFKTEEEALNTIQGLNSPDPDLWK